MVRVTKQAVVAGVTTFLRPARLFFSCSRVEMTSFQRLFCDF